MKELIVKVEGGMVRSIKGLPEKYRVIIHDYDIDVFSEEDELQEDEEGNSFGTYEL
jgi:hypothetical protein